MRIPTLPKRPLFLEEQSTPYFCGCCFRSHTHIAITHRLAGACVKRWMCVRGMGQGLLFIEGRGSKSHSRWPTSPHRWTRTRVRVRTDAYAAAGDRAHLVWEREVHEPTQQHRPAAAAASAALQPAQSEADADRSRRGAAGCLSAVPAAATAARTEHEEPAAVALSGDRSARARLPGPATRLRLCRRRWRCPRPADRRPPPCRRRWPDGRLAQAPTRWCSCGGPPSPGRRYPPAGRPAVSPATAGPPGRRQRRGRFGARTARVGLGTGRAQVNPGFSGAAGPHACSAERQARTHTRAPTHPPTHTRTRLYGRKTKRATLHGSPTLSTPAQEPIYALGFESIYPSMPMFMHICCIRRDQWGGRARASSARIMPGRPAGPA